MSLSRVLTLSTAAVWGVMPDAIRNILPRPRETRTCAGGLHIALSTVGGPGTGRVARRLEEVLLTLQGVERAEVNGALGSIFVGGETDSIDLDKLLSIIDEFDTDEESDEEFDEELVEELDEDDGEEADKDQTQGSGLSSMVGHHTRAGIRLGASLIGTGLAFAGSTVQAPRLSPSFPPCCNWPSPPRASVTSWSTASVAQPSVPCSRRRTSSPIRSRCARPDCSSSR